MEQFSFQSAPVRVSTDASISTNESVHPFWICLQGFPGLSLEPFETNHSFTRRHRSRLPLSSSLEAIRFRPNRSHLIVAGRFIHKKLSRVRSGRMAFESRRVSTSPG